jgi:hypothetical protein
MKLRIVMALVASLGSGAVLTGCCCDGPFCEIPKCDPCAPNPCETPCAPCSPCAPGGVVIVPGPSTAPMGPPPPQPYAPAPR